MLDVLSLCYLYTEILPLTFVNVAEITVLLARSALPVHSICAAIQSIGIVRRDVEQDPKWGLGRAVLPAILLHGFFDFSILALAFWWYTFNAPEVAETDDVFGVTSPEKEEAMMMQELYGFAMGVVITLLGLIYYFIEARKQRQRLNALEMTTAEPAQTVGRLPNIKFV